MPVEETSKMCKRNIYWGKMTRSHRVLEEEEGQNKLSTGEEEEKKVQDDWEGGQTVNVHFTLSIYCQTRLTVTWSELNRDVRIGLFEHLKNEALVPWLKEGQQTTCLLEIALWLFPEHLHSLVPPSHTPVQQTTQLYPELCASFSGFRCTMILSLQVFLLFHFLSVQGLLGTFSFAFFHFNIGWGCTSLYLGHVTWCCGKTGAVPTGSLPEETR